MLHPLDMISVSFDPETPPRSFVNTDVAFAPVTRFNLRMHVDKEGRSAHLEGRHLYGSPGYDDFWQNRIEKFEQFCLPSVLNMTPRPHAWYILFGEIRPVYIQELLERLAQYPWIRPCGQPIDGAKGTEVIPGLLRALGHTLDKQFVCTSRLDSDDSLHQQYYRVLDDAIKRLRKSGFPDEPRCLSFPYGLAHDQGVLSVYIRRTMFWSIFEPVEEALGPQRGPHDAIREKMPVVEITTNQPMWIYQRHDDVLGPAHAMAAQRMELVDPARMLPYFGVAPSGFVDSGTMAKSAGATLPVVKYAADDPAGRAESLRRIRYWGLAQLEQAIELANELGLSRLAEWLEDGGYRLRGVRATWREIETADLTFLNCAMYARLGRQLAERGLLVSALRAYERAAELDPNDADVRVARDELAGSIASGLDLEEQLELQADGAIDEVENTVVVLASPPTDDPDDITWNATVERATGAAEAGFEVVVLVLPSWEAEQPLVPLPDDAPGIVYESVDPAGASARGLDERRRTVDLAVAQRLRALRPCLVATDGSLPAQAVAATVGRALGLTLDFSR